MNKGRRVSLVRLNLFSKFSLLSLLGVVLFAPLAQAIHLHALYTASCQREVGIILDVGPRRLQLLNLEGQIVDVERFEVIYYASFSVDVVPILKVNNPGKVPLVEVKTFQGGELQRLVRGWPVDFNKDKISFLNLRGSEIVIDRTSIWSIDYQNEPDNLRFQNASASNSEFVHPYAFSSCPVSASAKGGHNIKVYPQTLLSDPVAIKREFDRLAQGHVEIRRYVSDQQFYPVPEVYKNATTLGLWLSTGSRYGSSKTRDNNFTPFLVNEFSGGPFGFQSIFTSGSGPLPQSIHEETQTQVYYRMKADYFHFSGMVDPGLLLVGDKYKWAANDLGPVDMRAVESAYVEFGFDYGKMALEFFLGGAIEQSARYGDLFARQNLGLPRVGLSYQGYTWKADVMGGSANSNGQAIHLLRANFEWEPSRNQRFLFSVIDRKLDFSGEDQVGPSHPVLTFQASNDSKTVAAYGYWRFKARYWAGLFLGYEHAILRASQGANSDQKTLDAPKAGALISLSF